MKQRIQNKKRIACLCGYFVFVAFLSYTLGKYIQNVKTAIQVEVAASDYERVYEAGAPYEDGFGKYYIHYTGEKSGEDRTKVDIAEDMKDGKICGTVPDNTYKLFSNCSSKVDRVILADGMASDSFHEDIFEGTSHDIQLIYRDSTNSIDRTDTVFSNNKVMTYLYLTPECLEDGDAYTGTVKNIYVSKEIVSLDSLFCYSDTLEAALFDEKGTWETMFYTFAETTNFHIDNYGFEFPQQLDDMAYTFYYSAFNDADMEVIKDKIPNTVQNMDNTFSYAENLTKIPEGFVFPNNLDMINEAFGNTNIKTVDENVRLPSTVTIVSYLFSECKLLEKVPVGFFSEMNSDNYIILQDVFSDAEKLQGYIELPKGNIKEIGCFFQGAGTSAANMPGYSTPIVMVYNPDNQASKNYAETYTDKTNIYDETLNKGGKVTAITYDEYNLKNHFEKVSGEGPYTDSAGEPYYLKYVGPEKRVDLNDYALPSGKIYLRDKEINSTYKLFEGAEEIDRVIMTDDFKDKELNSNMFEGTSQDIQLIYKDGTSPNDKTNTVFSNNKVMTYLYLIPEYLKNGKYIGIVKNIYVSKEISSLQSLFSESQTLEYVLFDENGTWEEMSDTFFGTTNFHVTNYGFEFPQQLTDMSYTFVQSAFNDKDMEAIKNKIPNTITYMQNTFSETKLTKIPEGFILPGKLAVCMAVFSNIPQLKTVDKNMTLPSTVKDASSVFQYCPLLETVPAGLFSKMNVEKLEIHSAFYGDEKLRGYIEIPKENISAMEYIFKGAGTSSANLPNYSTPIVMAYNPGDPKSTEYATTYSEETNVYNKDSNPSGKVTAITYDDYKLDISFEKVSGEGPYKDADGDPYYVRYKGTDKRVDLDDFTQSDGKVYWNGMELNSTYKLFENATEIDRVLLPESFNTVEFKENMFDGTSQDIQLIYKDSEADGFDKTDTVFTNSKVITYYYADDQSSMWITGRYPMFTCKNIFIASDWDISHLNLRVDPLYDGLQYVLFDEKGNSNWTNLDSLFKDKPNFHTTNYGFDIPDTVTSMESTFEGSENTDKSNFGDADMQAIKDKLPSQLQSLKSTFKNTKITKVPSDFNIPDTVTDTSNMFSYCRSLKTVENGFQLPDNVTDASYMFAICRSLEKIEENFKLPIGVKDISCMFDGCESLKSIPQNMLKDVECTEIAYAFRSCRQLRGIIYMPIDIKTYNSRIFYYTADDVTDKYGTYPTPIVVVYNGLSSNLCESLSSSSENIYTPERPYKVLALTYEEYEASITTNSLTENQETSVQSEIKAEPIEESITIQVEVREPEVKNTDQDKVENLNQVQSDDISMLIKDVYEKNDYVDWVNKGNTDNPIKKRQRAIEGTIKYKI